MRDAYKLSKVEINLSSSREQVVVTLATIQDYAHALADMCAEEQAEFFNAFATASRSWLVAGSNVPGVARLTQWHHISECHQLSPDARKVLLELAQYTNPNAF